ncbi:lipase lipl-5 [Rhipicephalus sanguineus]|uniref:lipase lipl-5 n=1 Tax=Rhipicephalus sanguineus TaxID=34632 RepID=UPI0018950F2F|nr:lipase lipl-5 [Rhipicephalus sanguineus]
MTQSSRLSRFVPVMASLVALGGGRESVDRLVPKTSRLYTGKDPDITDIETLVTRKGYPFERHSVVTDDGYVIEMHRIPWGRAGKPPGSSSKTQPVLLMSGLVGDSSNYVFDFPDQSLGFIMADKQYDVWIGNVRGNSYGKVHKKLKVRSKAFWNFSFHEHAVLDLPAQIDYVLRATERQDIPYVAVSQGTLMLFAMLSERPEYNRKVKAFAALAPFNKLSHVDLAMFTVLTPYAEKYLVSTYHKRSRVTTHEPVQLRSCCRSHAAMQPTMQPCNPPWAFRLTEDGRTARLSKQCCSFITAQTNGHEAFLMEVLQRGAFYMPWTSKLCALPTRAFCSWFADKVGNVGSKYINETRLPVYLHFFPGGTSSKNIVHFAQLINSARPRKFDYGPRRNMLIYGQRVPAEYTLSNVQTDVAIFFSQGDHVITPPNVQELIQELGPRVKLSHSIEDPYYTHVHFLMSLNNADVLFGRILSFLERYTTAD